MPAHVKRVIAWIRVEMERKKKGTTELIGERERERKRHKKKEGIEFSIKWGP